MTAETLRYFLLTTHYRSDVNFSNQSLSEAKAGLDNLYGLFQRLEEPDQQGAAKEPPIQLRLEQFTKAFEEGMDDDFNTPKAFAEFQQLRTDVNQMLVRGFSEVARNRVRDAFRLCGEPLGLFQLSPHDWVFRPLEFQKTVEKTQDAQKELTDEWIQEQIQQRAQARLRKDFAAADKYRQDLAAKGIILEDRPDGTTRWKR